jgi:hypothetical protein
MKINFGPVRSLQARTTDSQSDDGGVYVHAELAVIDSLVDRDYATSVGLAFRKDEMSKEAKKNRQALLDAQAKGSDEYNRVRLEQVSRLTSDEDQVVTA